MSLYSKLFNDNEIQVFHHTGIKLCFTLAQTTDSLSPFRIVISKPSPKSVDATLYSEIIDQQSAYATKEKPIAVK